MSDDLVKQLRGVYYADDALLTEAADRIEALAQERDAAVERAKEFSRYLAVETLHAEDAEARLVRKDILMEAGFAEYGRRLALAMEALETAKSEMRDWACDHPSMRKINAAIAQIEGEQE